MSDKLITVEERKDPLSFIQNPSAEALQAALAEGNLAKLTPPQRLQFLAAVSQSVGLNPLTQPFEFITFQGRIRLYVKRDATDQLRKMHDVSISITGREQLGDLLCVTAKATMPSGRCDEAIGVLSTKGVSGDALAILIMKAETKAKRRVTLSICGLGFMDESEVEDAQKAQEQQQEMARSAIRPQAEGMETLEAEVLPPHENGSDLPRHWSDLMLENAYRLVTFHEGQWSGKALWEVNKEKKFMEAFEQTPRDDSPIRHALDCMFFLKLKPRLEKKGYDLDEATAALRKTGFLDEETQITQVPGAQLEDLATAINELPPLDA